MNERAEFGNKRKRVYYTDRLPLIKSLVSYRCNSCTPSYTTLIKRFPNSKKSTSSSHDSKPPWQDYPSETSHTQSAPHPSPKPPSSPSPLYTSTPRLYPPAQPSSSAPRRHYTYPHACAVSPSQSPRAAGAERAATRGESSSGAGTAGEPYVAAAEPARTCSGGAS